MRGHCFNRLLRLAFLPMFWLAASLAHGQEVEPKNWSHQIIRGPESPAQSEAWRQSLAAARAQWRSELFAQDKDWDRQYRNPRFAWTQKDFVQPQVMAHDRLFFDVERGAYTVARFLEDVEVRYGGVDSVLIWPTYPNIGVDERNQYDLFRDLPGGLEALRAAIQEFHQRGVRVLLPLNPWDNGTRDEGLSNTQSIVKLLGLVGADGFNGDTMVAPSREFIDEAESKGQDIVIEPEVGVFDNLLALGWSLMSWGYWVDYQAVPGVDRYKLVESRHMTHVCRRESHDRTDELQLAWFNGTGFESWENIWGAWNGLTPRDAEALRRLAYLERTFAKLLVDPNWQPHVATEEAQVYASKFSSGEQTLWTFVNRSNEDREGVQIRVQNSPKSERVYYDLWHGEELQPPALSFSIEKNGFGAVLETTKNQRRILGPILHQMRKWAERPLSDWSKEWRPLPQKLMSEPPFVQATARFASDSKMILIPAARNFEFKVSSVAIEKFEGGDFQYPWESSPQLEHRHVMPIASFLIDKNLVTNREFKRFMDLSRYWPRDAHNFLKHWVNGQIRPGDEDRPVTWVSLDDARAYAAWAGKRLPHEWEWQYAAQGLDGRAYPWGNSWLASAVPELQSHRGPYQPEVIGLHPAGASPFGVFDLVGNVWQWTDEYADAHTRAAVLRGGSSFRPQGSDWYFPQGWRLDQHGKYLLMAPSLDRSSAIGFRCARSLALK